MRRKGDRDENTAATIHDRQPTTTGDIYTDWDIDQLEQTMRDVVGEDER